MDAQQLEALVEAVVRELKAAGMAGGVPPAAPVAQPPPAASVRPPAAPVERPGATLRIDLPDPTGPQTRGAPGVRNPSDPEGLQALMETTPARIGVGRAGSRARTRSLLLFQSDLAVTQDALFREVAPALLDEFHLFSVSTRVTGGKQEYLLRPDLGRALSDEARRVLVEKCVQSPNVQVCVGDGLSATAIEANLRMIFPVLQEGCRSAGLSWGTPFFIQYCRVGVMNDIGDLLKPDVLILLIGERPGLGRAESMSAYMAYRPHSGHTDAEREVICNIYDEGGTNPLEAGAYALQMARRMIQRQASGVRLKMMEG